MNKQIQKIIIGLVICLVTTSGMAVYYKTQAVKAVEELNIVKSEAVDLKKKLKVERVSLCGHVE